MISIIIPVYKVEPFLHQCLDSVLSQTYRDIEIILIDDSSPDRCGEICEEYARKDDRVRVFHTESRGVSAARNLGLREANGEYIGFTDPDDWIEPDMYEVLLKRLSETDADISACSFWYEYESEQKKILHEETTFTGEEALGLLVDENISNHVWNKLYRRQLFKTIQFPEGRLFEDIWVMHRLFIESRLVALTSVFGYHYRQRSDSICQNVAAKNLFDYVDSRLSRCLYLKENKPVVFNNHQEVLLRYFAEAYFRLLKWWHVCSRDEKQFYSGKLKEFSAFARSSIPIFGIDTWPVALRVSTLAMYCPNEIVLYWLYRMYRLHNK